MGVINGSGSGTCRDWEAARGFGRSRGELFGSQIHNQRKRRGPGSVLGSQALDPAPRPVPSLEERAAPTGPASPGRKLLVVGAERASSPGGPSPGVTLGKPCLCIKIPGSSLSGCRFSVVTLVTALFLPAPAVPSCPQRVAAWYPSPLPVPRSPLPKADCHSQPSAWQRRAPREFQSSPWGARVGGKLEPPEPGLCRPLPAGFAAQHTRSCCDYKRLLWAPSQERRAATPTLPLSEGEDQGTGSWLVLPSTSPCPTPASPDRLVGTSPWWVKPTQEAWLPRPQQDPSLGLPADKMGSQRRPLCLP